MDDIPTLALAMLVSLTSVIYFESRKLEPIEMPAPTPAPAPTPRIHIQPDMLTPGDDDRHVHIVWLL